VETSGSFDDMQKAVGSVIRLWVRIEQTAQELVGGPSAQVRPFVALLETWASQFEMEDQPLRTALVRKLSSDLRQARKVRNGICHGYCGIVSATDIQEARLSWHHEGRENSLTWNDLQVHLAWLSKVPNALHILACGDMGRYGRLVDSAENREWWVAEYGVSAA
jgi:hypothetical protein